MPSRNGVLKNEKMRQRTSPILFFWHGWLSEIQTSDQMPQIVKKLHELRADSPRRDTPFSICAAVADAFTADAYRRLEDLGVTHLITVPWLFYGRGDSLQEKCDGIRRFGDEVLG